ncbi:uncharacterized protein sync [Mugil cephalus]|uniref:uncharacterized protein sync n=1 Tax=Mugil cephalus TaxID=48193 RepID=UPI001FB65909|nr:uncharacterized protein sync [Mugil cephalus]
MDDLDDDISSPGFERLFIKEEEGDPDGTIMEQRECNTNLSGLTFAETQLKQSALIKPYLQEMDELLKGCEELTGIPFGSHSYSTSYTETSLSESSQRKEQFTMDGYGETSPQEYISTSYIDTHMDGAGIEERPAQGCSQSLGTIINRCGGTTEVSRQVEMPLTSAGNKLSETMVEYEAQLLGMLAMLESCMEEAGMDFDPQGWESPEYVHINKNPPLYRGTTLVPIHRGSLSQPMQVESWIGECVGGDEVLKDNRNRSTAGSETHHLTGSSGERLERQGNFTVGQGGVDAQIRASEPPMPFDGTEQDPMYYESTKTEHIFPESMERKGRITGIDELAAEERLEHKIDMAEVGSGVDELGILGTKMEECIEEVHRLETRRKELLVEVLQLRRFKGQDEAEGGSEENVETDEQIDSKVAELMNVLQKERDGRAVERKREIQSLREERAEEERRMWKVNLERQGLQEELIKVKRKLFAMAKGCAQNQATLNNQRREVELLQRDEEMLNSLVVQLTEEAYQIRSAQQQQLLDLRAKLHAQSSSQNTNTQEELTECRRHSCGDIQQYLEGGLKALEQRYEPVLLALLKRREAAASALVKTKEQAQELKTQLIPLREEMQKLKLQRACLEEKLKLIHIHRREDVGQYKETVYCLEESSRELKTELNIQKRKTKEIEELRDSLTKQLLLYRAAIDNHDQCDHEEKT